MDSVTYCQNTDTPSKNSKCHVITSQKEVDDEFVFGADDVHQLHHNIPECLSVHSEGGREEQMEREGRERGREREGRGKKR